MVNPGTRLNRNPMAISYATSVERPRRYHSRAVPIESRMLKIACVRALLDLSVAVVVGTVYILKLGRSAGCKSRKPVLNTRTCYTQLIILPETT